MKRVFGPAGAGLLAALLGIGIVGTALAAGTFGLFGGATVVPGTPGAVQLVSNLSNTSTPTRSE